MLKVDLDKPGLAGSEHPLRQYRDAADNIPCAEVKMDRQSIAQRSVGEP